MATNPHGVLLTYADYAQLPDDRNRYEILDGVLAVTPGPSTSHQNAAFNLAAILRGHVLRHQLGKVFIAPFDVLLSQHNVVQPDVLFVSRERLSIVHPANVQGAPDLVVEVLSPSTALNDLNTKRQIYAAHGVANYWVADPALRVITSYVLSGDSYEMAAESGTSPTFSTSPFDDLLISLADIWD